MGRPFKEFQQSKWATIDREYVCNSLKRSVIECLEFHGLETKQFERKGFGPNDQQLKPEPEVSFQ
jgi:hypothetical protein